MNKIPLSFFFLKTEKFCNQVAGEILLPKADLEKIGVSKNQPLAEIKEAISTFSSVYKISHTMISYNLFLNNYISQNHWNELRGIFRAEYNKTKNKNKEKKSSPDYYVVRRHRIGDALIGFVSQNLQMGEITSIKAAKVLGVKPQNLEKLIRPPIDLEHAR